MKIYVAHSGNFDFENKLYLPLRASSLASEHEIFLPHENGEGENTKELMKTYDLVIADVSEPSTGEGIEIGRADMLNIPIIFIYESGSKVSRWLKVVSEMFVEYNDPEDMIAKIAAIIKSLQ